MELLQTFLLWVHLFAAVLFVGGSFFMWIVVLPATKGISSDESERTRVIGMIARKFGPVAWYSLLVLVITGLYNATWYLPSMGMLLNTAAGLILLTKSLLVLLLIITVYIHNVYYGKRISRLAREKKLQELSSLRKKSRVVSSINLALMLIILLLAVMMQSY
ncbi:MAG: CopD family protein [Conexivisphaerales archaeon]